MKYLLLSLFILISCPIHSTCHPATVWNENDSLFMKIDDCVYRVNSAQTISVYGSPVKATIEEIPRELLYLDELFESIEIYPLSLKYLIKNETLKVSYEKLGTH